MALPDLLHRLLTTPGPSGHEGRVRRSARGRGRLRRGDERRDGLGGRARPRQGGRADGCARRPHRRDRRSRHARRGLGAGRLRHCRLQPGRARRPAGPAALPGRRGARRDRPTARPARGEPRPGRDEALRPAHRHRSPRRRRRAGARARRRRGRARVRADRARERPLSRAGDGQPHRRLRRARGGPTDCRGGRRGGDLLASRRCRRRSAPSARAPAPSGSRRTSRSPSTSRRPATSPAATRGRAARSSWGAGRRSTARRR